MNFTGKDYGFKFDAVVHGSFPKQEKEYDLIQELLAMNNRFRFYPSLIETNLDEDEVCLVVRKDFIFMPLCMPLIEHEVAHILEMKNKDRWTKNDLGMKFNIYSCGKSMFFAALSRESRVAGIQARLMGRNINHVIINRLCHSYWGHVENLLQIGRAHV